MRHDPGKRDRSRQIWLTGYAAEQALNAYLAALTLAAAGDEEFDAGGWRLDPGQARDDTAFDALFDKVVELGKALGVDDIAWPQGIPKPAPGLRITDRQRKATFDLVCIAGAWMFAHEVRHQIYECQENAPDIRLAEEVECDRWALRLLLDDAGTCAEENHWNPELVRAKRLWGILIAMLTILSVTPRPNWGEGTHPAIADRLTMVLDAACDPLPNWFWAVVASILASFARRLNSASNSAYAYTRVSARKLRAGFLDATLMCSQVRSHSAQLRCSGTTARKRSISRLHLLIVDQQESEYLVIASSDCLLTQLVLIGSASVEPCVGTNFSRGGAIRLAAEQDVEGKAGGVKIVLWKPVAADICRTAEPFPALRPMANQQGRGVAHLDRLDRGRNPADPKPVGNSFYRLKAEALVLADCLTKEVRWHQEIGRVSVSGLLHHWTVVTAAVYIFRSANEGAAPVMGPVPDFVGEGESPPSPRTSLVDGDDRLVVPTNDTSLPTI